MFVNILVAAASATTTFVVSRRNRATTTSKSDEDNASSSSKKENNNATIDFPPFLARDEKTPSKLQQQQQQQQRRCFCQTCPPDSSVKSTFDENNDDDNNNKENFGLDSPPKKKPNPLSKEKRERYLSWDDYFMTVAFLSSQRSKDPNKQVGAVIASEENLILGVGYNGFPRGCGDDALPWAKKSPTDNPLETKYAYVCHAEMNAIMNKNSADVKNGTMYVTMYPCNECAKLMIQAGIREVVYCEGKLKNDNSSSSTSASNNSSKEKKAALLENTKNGDGAATGAVEKKEEKKVDPSYFASQKLLALAGITVRKYEPKVKVDLTYLRY